MVSLDDAAAYLIEHNLVSAQSIIDGDLTVTSALRRNRNMRVTRRDGIGYLIKQPDDPNFGGWQSLRWEAAFYSFCQQAPDLAALRELLPRMVYTDDAQALLALELLNGAAPLWSYYNRFEATAFPAPALGPVGQALGTLHQQLSLARIAADNRLSWLRRDLPWILQVHKPGPELLADISAANYQTLKIVQTDGMLSRHIDGLRSLWQPGAVIHNDIKSDNVLLIPGEQADDAARVDVRLVDWELVQLGDPAWDVAGLLQDFVLFWIFSMSPAASVESMVASARYPLATLQPALRAFWRGYCAAARHGPAEANALLARAVRFSAARLIQSAFEIAQMEQALPAASVLLLQISANLLTNPDVLQVQLYGLFQEVAAR